MAKAKDRHPEVYIERHEDTRKRKRTVPMEVMSMGYSRTGTMTVKAAFETLGIPTWHWVTMSENPPDLEMWTEALTAKFEPDSGIRPFGRAEFDSLLGKWGATTDQPAAMMAEELLAAYPDAKVVLVERDVDRWYKSFSDTVINGNANPFVPFIAKVDKMYIGQMFEQASLQVKHYFNVQEPRTYGPLGLLNNPEYFSKWRANAKKAYLAHNETIKRVTPKDRLLLFKLDDGWEPLCKFLGKPIPDVPFPRVNETLAVQEKINLYIVESYKRTFIRLAKQAAPVVLVVVAVVSWWAMR